MKQEMLFSGRKKLVVSSFEKSNAEERTDHEKERKNILKTTEKKGGEGDGKREVASKFVLAAGGVAILLFLFFGAFGRGVSEVSYSNYTSAENDGAISVFSQIIRPDGQVETSGEDPFAVRDLPDKTEVGSAISANAENSLVGASESWNFWQYLCDSLARIFGIANAE